jgi:hypothetical protein
MRAKPKTHKIYTSQRVFFCGFRRNGLLRENHTHTKRKRWGEVSVVLFAIIGATIKAGTAYWICYAVYCLHWLLKTICNFIED